MKTWTNPAEQRLNEYLDDRARREGFSGEDAEELKSDLRRHLHEEAEKEEGGSIGLMQLERILGRLDAGYRSEPVVSATPPAPRKTRVGAWFWGVIAPVGIGIFEMISNFCGSVFFTPVPTAWHALLVLLVPAINAWLLLGAPRGRETGKGVAAGVATVAAIFYALLFLPLLPLSVLALIFLGMGLLSLAPVIAGYTTWRIGKNALVSSLDPTKFRMGRRIGMIATVALLCVLEVPGIWTRTQVAAAVNGESQEVTTAVGRLRAFHSERALRAVCYETGSGDFGQPTDTSGWMALLIKMMAGNNRADVVKARDVYFRVTGKPVTSLKPPRFLAGSPFKPQPNHREWEFDNHLGGDNVAVRLRNLDMTDSRFDGHVDARSGLGYGEWTMVFHNRAANAQEARCQVLLPRDGRISRLTLWVNGEPREAAFNAVSKVKAAYKEIAVVQRRDPVLVTQSGPDTVLVQCFPVPPGGDMKIRFGITAPLDGDLWEMPRILERNFGMKDDLRHAVWLQGERSFSLVGRDMPARKSAADGPGHSLAQELPAESTVTGNFAVKADGVSDAPATVWCEDRFAPAFERYLIREPSVVRRKPDADLIVVVDGSASMAEVRPWLSEVLRKGAWKILLADDGVRVTSAQELSGYQFSGGRDNEPALREAVRRVKSGEAGDIVWIHGPQPVGLTRTEALLQLIERGTRRPVIHEVAAVAGPNRLAEALHGSGVVRRGPLLMAPEENLSAFLDLLSIERDETVWHWRREANAPGDLGAPVWDHLARQWAMDCVDSPRSTVAEADHPAIAARYQLVTRVSGAVVLETMEQFERHGLKPVDADSVPQVPGVPEPSVPLLILISSAGAAMRRKR